MEAMRIMLQLDKTKSSALETTQELIWFTIKYPTVAETVKQLVDLTQTNIQSAMKVFHILDLCLPNPTSCLFGTINSAFNQCSEVNKSTPKLISGTDQMLNQKTPNKETNSFTKESNNQTETVSNDTGSGSSPSPK